MPFTDNATGAFFVPGPAGASAYDAWLALGNTGTLADFIAAQKGLPGADSTVPGPPGRQGEPGAGTMVSAVRSAIVAPSTYVVRLADGTCATANPTNMAHQGLVIGLDVIGGAVGSVAQITALGPISGVSGTFSAGDAIWIGDGTTGRLGSPVNVPPAASSSQDIWRQQVGTAATASVINGLLGLPYRVRASAVPALVGNGSYIALSSVGQAVAQAADAPTARSALGAASTTDLAAKWDDTGLPPQSQKINFRQKKFVITDYGAIAQSTTAATTNSTAFNLAVAAVQAQAGAGTIVVPNDRFFFNATLGNAPFPHGVDVEGSGANSEVYFNNLNSGPGLALYAADNTGRIGLRNLRVIGRNGTGLSGQALVIVQGGGGLQSVSIDTLNIDCDSTCLLSTYLRLYNPNYSHIQNVCIDGQQGAYGSTGVGVDIKGLVQSTDVKLDAVAINRIGTAFNVTMSQTTGQYGIEGVTFRDCIVVGSQIGLAMTGGWYSAPGHGWRGGHMNVQQYGFALKKTSQFSVDSTLIYMDINGSPQAFYYAENGIDLHVNLSKFCTVDQLNTGKATPNIPGVSVGPGVGGMSVIGNHFSGFTTAAPAVSNTSGSSGIRAGMNFKPAGGTILTANVTDLGGNGST